MPTSTAAVSLALGTWGSARPKMEAPATFATVNSHDGMADAFPDRSWIPDGLTVRFCPRGSELLGVNVSVRAAGSQAVVPLTGEPVDVVSAMDAPDLSGSSNDTDTCESGSTPMAPALGVRVSTTGAVVSTTGAPVSNFTSAK